MLSLITPHLQLASVLELDLDRLRLLGLDGLLLDVDSTLKDHPATTFPSETLSWVRSVQAGGVRLCLVSNGRPRRIGGLAEQLGVPFVAQSFKPLPFGCKAGLRKLDLPAGRVAMVGDQVFADVMAGRLAGLFTILVKPTSPEEPWFTKIKRPVERRVLHWINRPARPMTTTASK